MGLLSTIGAASGRAFGLTRVGAAIRDAYFNLTTLLLPGNGTNGAQNNTFLDSSSNNFTITRNGNTTQGTFSPFSQTGWSNFFNGSTDYISVADNAAFTLGSGDFTIEFWVYSTTAGTRQFFAGQMNSAGANISVSFSIEKTSGNKLLGAINSGTTQYAATSSGDIPLNAWTHIALVRDGNTLRQYINGVQDGTVSVTGVTANDSSSQLAIGRLGEFTSNYYFGYISNFRFVKGTCLYTGGTTFTPPTSPLTNITSTSLLTCQSNRFVDNGTANSGSGFAITVNGTPSVQAFSPFAPTAEYSAATVGGSGYFDGAGDYLVTPSSANLAMGSGDLTVECWFYAIPSTNQHWIFDFRTSGSESTTRLYAFIHETTNVLNIGFGTFDDQNAGTPTKNTWNHLAIVRSGSSTNNVSVYLNGSRNLQLTDTTNLSTNTQVRVGRRYIETNSIQYMNGYIAGLRALKGTAQYSGSPMSPSVPTAPPTAVTNTQLLLNFTNAGITDATANNDLETVGNAQISTTQSKFGGSSMYFDGTGDGLILPASPFYNFLDGNFTVEAWVYIAGNSPLDGLSRRIANVFSVSTSSAFSFNFIIRGDGTTTGTGLEIYNGTNIVNVTGTISQSTWHHIAVTKSGTSVYFFLNGTQMGTTQTTSGNWGSATVAAQVGRAAVTSYTFDLNGYIDDLRITRFARYTTNFTAPTAAFALQ